MNPPGINHEENRRVERIHRKQVKTLRQRHAQAKEAHRIAPKGMRLRRMADLRAVILEGLRG